MKIVARTKKQVYKHWIAALRSGKYQQGRAALKRENEFNFASFCCLGVLCDLAAKDGGEQWHGKYYGNSGGLWAFPPDTMVEFMVSDSEKFRTLAHMNDQGKTFDQIADYIEREIMPVECK